jgi:trimeric autotransporter adhesin
MRIYYSFSVIFILISCSIAFSQIPSTISYQGLISDTNGIRLEGNHNILVSLYLYATGGNAIWSEIHENVTFSAGVFDIILGSINPLTLPFDNTYYLQISVDGGEPLPRTQFSASPYSFISKTVIDSGITTSKIADTAVTNSKIRDVDWSKITGIPSPYNGWGLTGNSQTNASTNFIGTTDNIEFVIRTNNVERLRIKADGSAITGKSNNILDLGTASNSIKNVYMDGKLYLDDSVFIDNAGTGNTFLGISYTSINTGQYNTFAGNLAGKYNTSGLENTAIGYKAMFRNSTGSDNIAIGCSSLYSTTTGLNNLAIGSKALYFNSTGSNNVALGNSALFSNSYSSDLVAIGDSALFNNGDSDFNDYHSSGNSAIGSKALFSNTSGFNNTAYGYQSLYANTIGYYNTAAGYQSLYSNSGGYNNTAYGYQALFLNLNGYNNAATGAVALYSNISGINNTANGYYALFNNTSGSNNCATGTNALSSNKTGSYNSASGKDALYFNYNGSNNSASGYLALYRNTSGSFNTANGSNALRSNTIGDNNTAIGSYALNSNTIGNENTAIGFNALYIDSSGNYNTAVGKDVLYNNKTGNYNTANGFQALVWNRAGSFNTANGSFALYLAAGNNNTAMGAYSHYFHTIGDNNTAIGANALYSDSTGYNNTAIGANTDVDTVRYNVTVIGYGAKATANNQVRLGNDDVSSFYCKGAFTSPSGSSANMYISASGQIMRAGVSSLRYKKDIRDLQINTDNIYNLRPVSYISKIDGQQFFGLIAEEVAAVIPELAEFERAKDVIPGSNSEEMIPDAVRYPMLSVLMLNEMKKQKIIIDGLNGKIESQQQEIMELRNMILELKQAVESSKASLNNDK